VALEVRYDYLLSGRSRLCPSRKRRNTWWARSRAGAISEAGEQQQRAFEASIPLELSEGTILVTGTAGAGTSTTLMRTALSLVGEDRDVRWIDSDQEVDARELGRWLRANDGAVVVVIDDADTLGRGVDDVMADARASLGQVLLILGMRAVAVTALSETGSRTTEPSSRSTSLCSKTRTSFFLSTCSRPTTNSGCSRR
jgi:hypothetical protein